MSISTTKQEWTQSEWEHRQQRPISEAEYFGSVNDIEIAAGENTVTVNCKSLESLEQLADMVNSALAHWKRAQHQISKARTVRSILLPVNLVKLTLHKDTKQMTCLGYQR